MEKGLKTLSDHSTFLSFSPWQIREGQGPLPSRSGHPKASSLTGPGPRSLARHLRTHTHTQHTLQAELYLLEGRCFSAALSPTEENGVADLRLQKGSPDPPQGPSAAAATTTVAAAALTYYVTSGSLSLGVGGSFPALFPTCV